MTGYPTTVFLRANGDHLVNVPGYIPADRFLTHRWPLADHARAFADIAAGKVVKGMLTMA